MPCVGCSWVSKGLKGLAFLAMHFFSFSHLFISHTAQQAIPFYWSQKTKEDQHMCTKTKSLLCLMEAGISCFTIFGKDVSGWRKYIELRSKYWLFCYEWKLGYTTLKHKQTIWQPGKSVILFSSKQFVGNVQHMAEWTDKWTQIKDWSLTLRTLKGVKTPEYLWVLNWVQNGHVWVSENTHQI